MSHTYQVGDPGNVKILALARANRVRGKGVGDDLLEQTVNRVAERADAAGLTSVKLWGLIHHRNHESEAMADRARLLAIDGDAGYNERWMRIDIAD